MEAGHVQPLAAPYVQHLLIYVRNIQSATFFTLEEIMNKRWMIGVSFAFVGVAIVINQER